MSHIDQECRYADTHEWARLEGDTVTVGISDHAQELLGDLVYVELPEVGTNISAGDETGVVESVKAASDIYSPISGIITTVNNNLEGSPELVNSDPYNDGWLFQVKVDDPAEVESLLSPEAYQSAIEE